MVEFTMCLPPTDTLPEQEEVKSAPPLGSAHEMDVAAAELASWATTPDAPASTRLDQALETGSTEQVTATAQPPPPAQPSVSSSVVDLVNVDPEAVRARVEARAAAAEKGVELAAVAAQMLAAVEARAAAAETAPERAAVSARQQARQHALGAQVRVASPLSTSVEKMDAAAAELAAWASPTAADAPLSLLSSPDPVDALDMVAAQPQLEPENTATERSVVELSVRRQLADELGDPGMLELESSSSDEERAEGNEEASPRDVRIALVGERTRLSATQAELEQLRGAVASERQAKEQASSEIDLCVGGSENTETLTPAQQPRQETTAEAKNEGPLLRQELEKCGLEQYDASRDGKGRGVRAAPSGGGLDQATTIWEEASPYVSLLRQNLWDARCQLCMRAPQSTNRTSEQRLRRCGRCGCARYCSRHCQQLDFVDHRHECATMAKGSHGGGTLPASTASSLLP